MGMGSWAGFFSWRLWEQRGELGLCMLVQPPSAPDLPNFSILTAAMRPQTADLAAGGVVAWAWELLQDSFGWI